MGCELVVVLSGAVGLGLLVGRRGKDYGTCIHCKPLPWVVVENPVGVVVLGHAVSRVVLRLMLGPSS